jgi:hypothetical protein
MADLLVTTTVLLRADMQLPRALERLNSGDALP